MADTTNYKPAMKVTQEYKDNWDRIFGDKKINCKHKETCESNKAGICFNCAEVKERILKQEKEKCCETCKYSYSSVFKQPCQSCEIDNYSNWETSKDFVDKVSNEAY